MYSDFIQNHSKSMSEMIGKTLETLYKAGDHLNAGEIPFGKLAGELGINTDSENQLLYSFIAFFEKLGLVYLDNNSNVRITSENSRFILGSLGKYVQSSRNVITVPRVDEGEERYFVQITKALETLRYEKPHADHDHLHTRRIVNVIVKGRQIRKWRYRDVYLHVFHSKWNKYHLIGLSHMNGEVSDDQIADLAMLKLLDLKTEPRQYDLDPNIKPNDLVFNLVSESHGAITKYEVCYRVATQIRTKLRLNNLVRSKVGWEMNRFRWFSEPEINAGEGRNKEKIMKSSQLVIEQIKDTGLDIKVIVKGAKDSRPDRKIVENLSNVIAIENLVPLGVGLLFWSILRLAPQDISFLGITKEGLAMVADLLGVLGFAITIANSLRG